MILQEAIKKAEGSEGYFITITTFEPKKKGKKLEHCYFTKHFPKSDLFPALDEVSKLLDKEKIQFSDTFRK
jgi:hypothetical protein